MNESESEGGTIKMTQAWTGFETLRNPKAPGLFPDGFARPRRIDPIQAVDEAVRTVLAEMFGTVRNPSPTITPTAPLPLPLFADRLFSLKQAETLASGGTIRIAVGTVVTPLARDLLKKKNVVVQLAGTAEIAATARGEWAFAIENGPGWLDALRRSMLDDAGRWNELAPSIDAATAWLGAGEGRGVLLVTVDGATAVWRACQSPGVRAAFAAEAADVHRAVEGLGANLIVVDPTGKSIAWIKQLATAFRRAGAPRDVLAAGIGGTS